MAVNVARATQSIARMSLMKFFPADIDARKAMVRLICRMANDNEQIDWLVNRMVEIHNEWPGPVELRAVFCSRYKPNDGIEADSLHFIDGIPPDPAVTPVIGIEAGAHRAISGTCAVSEDPEVVAIVTSIARTLKTRYSPVKPVTQEEIDAIKTEQQRNRKVLEEVVEEAEVAK